MTNSVVRDRFAPAPTGLMHLGNVRTALMNFLFAQQRNGVFILRIEDTDQQRDFDPGARNILADLAWLELDYQEGPTKGGPHAPYFQSQRLPLYLSMLQKLIDQNAVYRCFCTPEELERKRERQIALKLPPRYDRTCLNLSPETIELNLKNKVPFVWRLKVPQHGSVDINDLARGKVHFEFKNFSDQPLTRQDGSFTFIFANFVDDLDMKVTHIFRGEDHITNTAIQTVLYAAFNTPLPHYWHMPMICNSEGKKLSKRDFGFSLSDLRQAGYLPEAICNYLAIIGGGSFEQEIMTPAELIKHVDFNQISTASQIRYDVEKLSWVNHKWIEHYEPAKLTQRCLPFLVQRYPQAQHMDTALLTQLLQTVKSDLTTLADCQQALHFYFAKPALSAEQVEHALPPGHLTAIKQLLISSLSLIASPDSFIQTIKAQAKEQQLPIKSVFAFIRLALMGQTDGPAIHDLINMLGIQESQERIQALCLISTR